MSTRRDFLNLAVKGSAMTAAAALLPGSASAQGNTSNGRSMNNMENNTSSSSNVHYKLPSNSAWEASPWEMNLRW